MAPLSIQTYVVGPVQTNCYFAINDDTKEVLIIDPGASAKQLAEKVKEQGLKPVAILLTHGHFDHIMGIDDFLKAFPVPVYAGEDELPVIEDDRLNVSCMYGPKYAFHGAQPVRDGQVIECAGIEVNVLHTPGHTVGGCCYYLPKEHRLFSGDTLFCASIGRTALPTGSSSQLVRSVQEKIMTLPDDTKIYPGHMEETSVQFEKEHNPFI